MKRIYASEKMIPDIRENHVSYASEFLFDAFATCFVSSILDKLQKEAHTSPEGLKILQVV